MFYVKDVKQKLCEAKQKLESFDGSTYEDNNDMVAEYCHIFDVCTSCFGSAVENDFDKFQRFLKKCSVDPNSMAFPSSLVYFSETALLRVFVSSDHTNFARISGG